MKTERSVRAARWGYLAISVCLCVFGAFLTAKPGTSLEIITNGAGIILICFGCVRIWGYFSNDLFRLAFQHGLATGILGAAVGVILLAKTEVVISLLCVILGITALMDALTKIEMSIDARAFGLSAWWIILTVGIAAGVVGFLLVLRPWDGARWMVTTMGIALLVEGILNLLTALTTIELRDKIHPKELMTDEESPWGI